MQFEPNTPIWLQVAAEIKRDIITGKAPPGSRLPSGRDMALQYKINPNTAARVYQELEQEGVCETRRGLGTYVAEDSEMPQRLRMQMARDLLQTYLEGMRRLGFTPEESARMAATEKENTHAGE